MALLNLLLAAPVRTAAESVPTQCGEYFQLVTRLVQGLNAGAVERALAGVVLAAEVSALPRAPAANDEADLRLEGRLRLILTLVQVLDCRWMGSKANAGVVELLITDFLFPEARVVAGEVPLALGQWGVKVRCHTRRSRQAAFELLADLATHCPANMHEVVGHLLRLHYSDHLEMREWEHLPAHSARPTGGYVGLKNAGATCYMNSVFQQLYMQPLIRKYMLSGATAAAQSPTSETLGDDERKGEASGKVEGTEGVAGQSGAEGEGEAREESVFHQLQAVFGSLQSSALDHFVPAGFWHAYKDYDGLPINVQEHQDAFEFFTRLQEQVTSFS
jgi:hypothetical protein